MIDPNETTFLQEGPVKITNRRTLIGTQTYFMSDITSIRVSRQGRSIRPLWLVIGGILLLSWSVLDQTGYYREFFNIGIALILVGTSLLVLTKPTYALQIQGKLGQSSILRSTNLSFIQKVVDAMNRALERKMEAAYRN